MRLHIDSLQEKLRTKELALDNFEKTFVEQKLSEAKFRSRIQILEKNASQSKVQFTKLNESLKGKDKTIDEIQS